LVEQRTENPCVAGSIPAPATTLITIGLNAVANTSGVFSKGAGERVRLRAQLMASPARTASNPPREPESFHLASRGVGRSYFPGHGSGPKALPLIVTKTVTSDSHVVDLSGD
jgi:hypothetical protein